MKELLLLESFKSTEFKIIKSTNLMVTIIDESRISTDNRNGFAKKNEVIILKNKNPDRISIISNVDIKLNIIMGKKIITDYKELFYYENNNDFMEAKKILIEEAINKQTKNNLMHKINYSRVKSNHLQYTSLLVK